MSQQPNGPDHEGYAVREQIDMICDDFEQAWLGGREPEIRDYLRQFSSPRARSALFVELLLLDVEYRRKQGVAISREAYLKWYPNFAEQVETVAFRLGVEAETPSRFETPASSDTTPSGGTAEPFGNKIDRFELIEQVGSGGCGVVWRARDPRLLRDVAVKVPHAQWLTEDELQRFLGEARAAAKLRHPAIVSIHEVGQDGHTPFIVSDFVTGEDLRKRLATERFTYREAAELCRELAAALDHAHENGVVHRDFKPANVLLDEFGRPHVADFGLAKLADDASGLTRDGQALGTPAYMSPEQARGDSSHVDRRTDVYALGAVLYEMLTGTAPFSGDALSVMHQVIDRDPPRPKNLGRNIPSDLETICLKTLDKDPAYRYATAKDMADDLGRFLDGESIVARPAGFARRALRRVRRTPLLAVSLLLALVVIVAVGALWIENQRRRELLGIKTVSITTAPPGARLALAPLDEITGEPDPDRVLCPSGRTPLQLELVPGDYFLVAVLDDGRFHEVFRRVPEELDQNKGPCNHEFWKILDDGTISLRKVCIPEGAVVEGMAHIEGSQDFLMGAARLRATPHYRRAVESFYIDPREFTLGDLEKHGMGKFGLLPGWEKVLTGDHAVPIRYDWAVAKAEHLGKRLPFEHEFEYAATRPDVQYVAVDDSTGQFAPGDQTKQEREGTPRIYGLLSNLAEWTATTAYMYDSAGAKVRPTEMVALDSQVVRGGDMGVVEGHLFKRQRDPRLRIFVSRHEVKPGLGFRCVRSAQPRFFRDH